MMRRSDVGFRWLLSVVAALVALEGGAGARAEGAGEHGERTSLISDESVPAINPDDFVNRPRPLIELGNPYLGTRNLSPGFRMPGGAVWQPSFIAFGAFRSGLQVFDQGQDALPYDEEFLLAALLHDVGKAIDRHDHVAAGLDALDGFISARTAWLIEHHMLAHAIDDRTIGLRALRRLQRNESYDELLLLGQCDRAGRQVGVPVPELDEALDLLRDMAETFGL